MRAGFLEGRIGRLREHVAAGDDGLEDRPHELELAGIDLADAERRAVHRDHDTLSAAMIERRRLLVSLTVAALVLAPAAADDKPLSFAFASQAGSGIYDIEGRVVQIYRIPVSFSVKDWAKKSAIGESRSRPRSPSASTTSSPRTSSRANSRRMSERPAYFPVSRSRVRAKRNWLLTPYVDFGAAKDFSGGALVWVYDVGLRSDVTFPAGEWDGLAAQEPFGRARRKREAR